MRSKPTQNQCPSENPSYGANGDLEVTFAKNSSVIFCAVFCLWLSSVWVLLAHRFFSLWLINKYLYQVTLSWVHDRILPRQQTRYWHFFRTQWYLVICCRHPHNNPELVFHSLMKSGPGNKHFWGVYCSSLLLPWLNLEREVEILDNQNLLWFFLYARPNGLITCAPFSDERQRISEKSCWKFDSITMTVGALSNIVVSSSYWIKKFACKFLGSINSPLSGGP